jgi:oxygen-independent coproporphyrinogen-3 oxidase
METLGIYLQVPFCAYKCSFCNFSSRVLPSHVLDAYCDALEQEIGRLPAIYQASGVAQRALGLPVDTVYIGGGTPSLLGANHLRQITTALQQAFKFLGGFEFTLEVTPRSVDPDFLTGARSLGINRLSIGAQSFDNRELRAVGRSHSDNDTAETVRGARKSGFTNINLDLIAGLPYQTESSWLRTLHDTVRLEPEHLSVYLFEIDEKSRLGKEILIGGSQYHASAVPDEDFMADAYELAREFLTAEGYAQYEISNFAVGGNESRHNRKYWRLEPYVGLGAGAHSFDGRCRWVNEIAIEAYQKKLTRGESPIEELHSLSPEEQLEEFFFLGLRERTGVDLGAARRRWGPDSVRGHEERIAPLARDGWLERVEDRVHLTERALLVSNEIFQQFLR